MHHPSPPPRPQLGTPHPVKKSNTCQTQGQGYIVSPQSVVGILSLCWISLEKSSLCFNADTLQRSKKKIFNGTSREKKAGFRVLLTVFFIFLFGTKAYKLTQELSSYQPLYTSAVFLAGEGQIGFNVSCRLSKHFFF